MMLKRVLFRSPMVYRPQNLSSQLMQFRYFSATSGIKINRNPVVTPLDALKAQLQPILPHVESSIPDVESGASEKLPVPECFYPWEQPVLEVKTCKAKKQDIRHSVYKLARMGQMIQKKHLYDAQQVLNSYDSKSAELIGKLVNSARKNGVQQGMQEDRMWIKTFICGKGLWFKKIDIKGRGKMGIIRVPKSSMKIVIEEKGPIEYYKHLLKGETPVGLADTVRQMLSHSDADFDKVQRLSFTTTSKGRYYRRTQFKRLVQVVQKEYKQRGIPMKKDKIERNLLDKTANEWYTAQMSVEEKLMFQNLSDRQKVFDKNYQKKL